MQESFCDTKESLDPSGTRILVCPACSLFTVSNLTARLMTDIQSRVEFYESMYMEELNDLYCSPNIVRLVKSKRLRWAGHVARMEEGRVVYKVLVGKPEGKRPLGRPRRRWEDNIKMDLQEVRRDLGDWMELA